MTPLIARAAALAVDDEVFDGARTAAVTAIWGSSSPAAVPALHGLVAASHVDVRIEALAALGDRDAWTEPEAALVRELLANPPDTATMRIRAPELRAAASRASPRSSS